MGLHLTINFTTVRNIQREGFVDVNNAVVVVLRLLNILYLYNEKGYEVTGYLPFGSLELNVLPVRSA